MKKYLIALAMILALGQPATLSAQKHRHHHHVAAAVVADSVETADELEAFSDTTSTTTVDEDVVVSHSSSNRQSPAVRLGWDISDDSYDQMMWIVLILLVLFVVSPVLILGVILYFIYKNRKQRLKLAEMAMKAGQPIPDGVVDGGRSGTDDDLRSKGIRQLALGVGLMIFLSYTAGEVGFGLGALVACLGLGKLIIAKTSSNKPNKTDEYEQL